MTKIEFIESKRYALTQLISELQKYYMNNSNTFKYLTMEQLYNMAREIDKNNVNDGKSVWYECCNSCEKFNVKLENILKKQVYNCISKEHWSCGIYAQGESHKKILYDLVKIILSYMPNEVYEIRRDMDVIQILFESNSMMKILYPNEHVRGYRFDSVIIDSAIDNHIAESIIYPRIILQRNFRDSRECENIKIQDRIFNVDIKD